MGDASEWSDSFMEFSGRKYIQGLENKSISFVFIVRSRAVNI